MITVTDLLRNWGSDEALARDVNMHREAVRAWRLRSRIPAAYWSEIVEAATRRGFNDVTVAALADAHAPLAARRRRPAIHPTEPAA